MHTDAQPGAHDHIQVRITLAHHACTIPLSLAHMSLSGVHHSCTSRVHNNAHPGAHNHVQLRITLAHHACTTTLSLAHMITFRYASLLRITLAHHVCTTMLSLAHCSFLASRSSCEHQSPGHLSCTHSGQHRVTLGGSVQE
jgi:hypothetical protein